MIRPGANRTNEQGRDVQSGRAAVARRHAGWRPRSLLGAAGLTIGLALLGAGPAVGYTGYVANSGDDDISVLDTTAGGAGAKVGSDIAVEGLPGALDVTPDGTTAYVVNALGGPAGNVSAIDTATNAVLGPAIPQTEGPADVAFTPDGTKAYVPNEAVPSVVVINTATRATSAINIADLPRAVDVTADGTRAIVVGADGVTQPDISVIDVPAGASDNGDDLDVGAVGDVLLDIAITPDDSAAYVVNADAGEVEKVNLTDPPTSAGVSIAVGTNPSAIAIATTPIGVKAFVTNTDSVSVIDVASDTLVATVSLDAGSAPSALALTPDGKRAYVTNRDNDDVTAIDTTTSARIGTDITVGDAPAGIALFTAPVVTPPSTPTSPTPVPEVVTPTLPTPVPGKTANAEATAGLVTLKCKDDSRFRELAVPEQVVVGCVIDATLGTVKLTTATGIGDETQTARFWAGRFKLLQNEANSGSAAKTERKAVAIRVVLKLAGPLLAASKVKASGGEPAARAAKKKKKSRKLWGSGKGSYRTKGNKGAATVRGTTWLTKDRSNGSTLVKVKKGTVSFRDDVKDKTVKVKAGERYVAKKRARR